MSSSFLSYVFAFPANLPTVQADVQGPVVLDTFQIRLSHILFQYSHRVIIDRNSTWNPYALAGSGCHLVTIPQDPLAFSVHFETPHSSTMTDRVLVPTR